MSIDPQRWIGAHITVPEGLRARPVFVIHLEDPPGSGLAACCGQPYEVVSDDLYRNVPRVACTGCTRPRP